MSHTYYVMKKNIQHETTLDDLAIMINKGFSEMQGSINGMQGSINGMQGSIDGIKDVQKDMLEELTTTHADVRYLRSGVDILTRNEAERDSLVKNLAARIHRLEQKAGLTK